MPVRSCASPKDYFCHCEVYLQTNPGLSPSFDVWAKQHDRKIANDLLTVTDVLEKPESHEIDENKDPKLWRHLKGIQFAEAFEIWFKVKFAKISFR